MKVQLVVVRGKPEGKVIPLVGSNFKIGRGETCHLRPNSEQVSREHAEFSISDDSVIVRDLGSRNGTLVNGKALTAECRLKDRDLVQVGPLTFAVSISDRPRSGRQGPGREGPGREGRGSRRHRRPLPHRTTSRATRSIRGCSATAPTVSADQPTAVYGGDTITITAFKDASATPPKVQPPPSASDDEYERQAEEVEEPVDDAAETADAILGEQNEDESERRRGRKRGRRGGRGRSPGRVPGRIQPLLCGQESSTATGQDGPHEAVVQRHQRRGRRYPSTADGTPPRGEKRVNPTPHPFHPKFDGIDSDLIAPNLTRPNLLR